MSTSSLSNDTATSVVMDNTRSLTEINEARKGEICPESENQGASSNPVQVHLKKIICIYLIHYHQSNTTILKKRQKTFFIQPETTAAPKSTSRRPDIDVLNISVTWLILLYHAVLIYCPYIPYYVKDPSIPPKPGPDQVSFYALVYIIFMNGWNMPLFFFLSGVSSFFSLKR